MNWSLSVGDILESNSDGTFKVVELLGKTSNYETIFMIEFLATGYRREARRNSIVRGRVRDWSVMYGKRAKKRICVEHPNGAKEYIDGMNILINQYYLDELEYYENYIGRKNYIGGTRI